MNERILYQVFFNVIPPTSAELYPERKRQTLSGVFKISPQPQRGIRIPAQGNALGIRSTPVVRSEGTPHTHESPTCALRTTRPDAALLQSASGSAIQSRSYTPG